MICSGSIVAWLLIAAWPVSSLLTRTGAVLAFCLATVTFIVNAWPYLWLRCSALCLIGICGVFAFLPPRAHPSAIVMRQEFVRALRRYEGVRYFWGGENCIGIDCSGLIRRGLIDSLLLLGVRTGNASLLRQSAWTWWHDFSANDLCRSGNTLATAISTAESINGLDHAKLLVGDLAVTAGGEHVIAYLGNKLWIEADPVFGRVVLVQAPCQTNLWFNQQVSIVRLKALEL